MLNSTQSQSQSQTSSGAFWGAMNREVGTIHAARNVGENGADQYSMYGLAGTRHSELQGALVAAFAGLTRGCSRERVSEFVRNIEVTARNQGDQTYQQAMATLMVLAFQTRDCRGSGKGERDLSRWMLLEMYRRFPRTVEALVPLFPEYGYWKDLALMIQDCTTGVDTSAKGRRTVRVNPSFVPLVNHLYQTWADQLLQDQQTLTDAETAPPGSEKPKLSLAAKYVPKEGRSFDRKYGCAKRLAQLLYPEQFRTDFRTAMRLFRQMVTRLNRAINTTECLMSAHPLQWHDIRFQLVPGCLLRRCRRAFLNLKGGSKCRQNDPRSVARSRVQCAKNLERHLELAKQGKVQVKGKQNFIHQIVEAHLVKQDCYTMRVDSKLSRAELDLLQLQWNDHREKLRAKIESEGLKVDRGVSLVDVSGSMNGTPMIVAVSLGLMVSELAPEPFGNRFLTFEDCPKWVEFQPDWPLNRKIATALMAPWGGTTDFLKAMDLMLEVSVKHRLQPEQLPEWFLVASDMQFNVANASGYGSYPTIAQNLEGETQLLRALREENAWSRPRGGFGERGTTTPWQTHHDILVKAFHQAGLKACGKPYTLPRMIYWNLRGDTVGFPVQSDTPNTQMLSGVSADLLPLVLEQRIDQFQEREPPTPWELFVKAMDQERYDPVLRTVATTGEGCFQGFQPPVRETEDSDTDDSMPELEPASPPAPPAVPKVTTGPAVTEDHTTSQPNSNWSHHQVANWLTSVCHHDEKIAEAVRREQVDGGTMRVIVQQADRESLVELGITSRIQQSRIFSQWAKSPDT